MPCQLVFHRVRGGVHVMLPHIITQDIGVPNQQANPVHHGKLYHDSPVVPHLRISMLMLDPRTESRLGRSELLDDRRLRSRESLG